MTLDGLLAGLHVYGPGVLLVLGVVFYLVGVVGVLRFPDLYTRLHALTKADNVGLGLICLGLAWQAGTALLALKLLLIWLLALLASAVSCHLLARYALRGGVLPWQR